MTEASTPNYDDDINDEDNIRKLRAYAHDVRVDLESDPSDLDRLLGDVGDLLDLIDWVLQDAGHETRYPGNVGRGGEEYDEEN